MTTTTNDCNEISFLVSPNLAFCCYDTCDKVNVAVNLIGYFQNLLYYDRGCRNLSAPPGGFCSCPTKNLLLQIVDSLCDPCHDTCFSQILDIKTRSLQLLLDGLYCSGSETSSTELNNFLTNLAYLIYPSNFYTTDDCSLATKVSSGPEKYYGLARGFHIIGRQIMTGFLGKKLRFDCGNWVKLGSHAQWTTTLKCVKINGDCITVVNPNEYRKSFKNYKDRIYRDRLLVYLAFVNWCINNQWHDNLLSFIYSGYNSETPKHANALTVEVLGDSPESAGFACEGTILRFLHSEDCYDDTNPPECPVNRLSMIEADRFLTVSEVNCPNSDCNTDNYCLYVPKVYWDFIVELQVNCYPGRKNEYACEQSKRVFSGPGPYKSAFGNNYSDTSTDTSSNMNNPRNMNNSRVSKKYGHGALDVSSSWTNMNEAQSRRVQRSGQSQPSRMVQNKMQSKHMSKVHVSPNGSIIGGKRQTGVPSVSNDDETSTNSEFSVSVETTNGETTSVPSTIYFATK